MTNVNELLKNCVIVNNRTKKAFELIYKYEFARSRYGDRDLTDCYGNYSIYKARAYKNICEECKKFGGYNMTTPTYNSNFFTQAYIVDFNGDTYLIYHTHHYRYAVLIPDVLEGELS